MVRVRFAPSPTGYLHVGGARTALFNYLFAKKMNGKFILRIEDTDLERSTKESETALIETMKWLGLLWDEGPDIGGEYGPYRQSERLNIYREMTYKLVDKGMAYEAFVYPEELEKIREELLSQKLSPHYDYQMLSKFDTKDRRDEFKNKGINPVIYFKMPKKDYVINDLIKGEVLFKEGTIGDFVILRSNGMPIYNFAAVVDDALMNITHVIRGDDHLSNTLRQTALYEAYDIPLPQFAHVSMILGADGSRLSKRHGATAVENYRDMGYCPESVINYLALLGWQHPEENEIMSIEKMTETFDLNKVSATGAIYDQEKLRWMNGVYLRQKDLDTLTNMAIPYVVKANIMDYDNCKANFKWLKEAIGAIKNYLHQLDEVPQNLQVFFKEPIITQEIAQKIKEEDTDTAFIELYRTVQEIDSWSIETIMDTFKKVVKETKVKAKFFYHSLRIVLTNEENGPELINIVHLIGRNKFIDRIGGLIKFL